jgi:hypothetical protein
MPRTFELSSIRSSTLSAFEIADLESAARLDRPNGRQAKTPMAAAKRYAQFALKHVREAGRRPLISKLTTTVSLDERGKDGSNFQYKVCAKYLDPPVVFERDDKTIEVRYRSSIVAGATVENEN